MHRIVSSLIFLCFSAALFGQINFTVEQHRVSASEIDLVFQAKIDKRWHVYSTQLPDNGPVPATFNVDKAEGIELSGSLAEGQGVVTRYDQNFGMELRYFEDSCTFTQRLKIISATYSLEGYLQYMSCNDVSCSPPKSVDVSVSGTDGLKEVVPVASDPQSQAPQAVSERDGSAIVTDSMATVVLTGEGSGAAFSSDLWSDVSEELEAFGGAATGTAEKSLAVIFLLGFLGGLVALFTPCVWPIIPMTVSFFLKRAGNKRKGVRDAITYGLSIIVIYVALGLAVTSLFGTNALNDLSTNAFFNIFFCLLLLIFAASFLGGFELTLPSSWGAAADSKAEKTTGLISIFLMAFTLALVSFSCTGPIIGFLLVEVSTSGGTALAPTIGMLGFAVALALPFTLFALFPTWLKSAPKSGGWLNSVKVVLGFLELAFALKFLSVADLAYGWGILDRETFLAIWIVLFALLGLYLLGFLRFPHDDDEENSVVCTSVPRFFLALASLAFAVYMLPGLWGAPLKAVSAFAPPMRTQDFKLEEQSVEPKFLDYEAGMAYAKSVGKPVMIDFTGHGCVNCRKMELAVWTDDKVMDIINNDYVLISLYVDEKTPLPETMEVEENGRTTRLRTIGDKWSYLQRTKFAANAQPFYVLLDNEGHPLAEAYAYDERINRYVDFLQRGLEQYRAR